MRRILLLALFPVLISPTFAQAPAPAPAANAEVSPAATRRLVYDLDASAFPKQGNGIVELELLREGERFLMESHEAVRGTGDSVRIELAAASDAVRQELLALAQAEVRDNLVLVVRLDGKEIERVPFRDFVGYGQLLREMAGRAAPTQTERTKAVDSSTGVISSAVTAQECENTCNSNYNRCVFTTPSCMGGAWCPGCEDALRTCLMRCPVSNPCSTDTCSTCASPSLTADHDLDYVPDRLEYDLAHKFFPNIWLQHLDKDLQPSYFYKGWTAPFTVHPVTQGLCDQDRECLEIRFGTPYTQDYGDNILGISGHFGDNEFYAALVQRTTTWSTASTSASYWQLIRDFTAAHWSTSGDSSRYGAYGNCPAPCGGYSNDESACLANRQWCSWSRSLCYGTNPDCINYWEQESCSFAGCSWKASSCTAPVAILCDSSTAVTTARTTYAAERKHGIYHQLWECEEGGLFDADTCPYNSYNLRSYKGQRLQNVGTQARHTDSIIQYPDGCYLYDVWTTTEFGGTGSNFLKIFQYQFNWDIPATLFTPPTKPLF